MNAFLTMCLSLFLCAFLVFPGGSVTPPSAPSGEKLQQKIVCPACGQEYPPDIKAVFCEKCGSRLFVSAPPEGSGGGAGVYAGLGMWEIRSGPGGSVGAAAGPYITNRERISGTYSCAGGGGDLDVRIVIDGQDITFLLYDVSGLPAAADAAPGERYSCIVTDRGGKEHAMGGSLNAAGITLDGGDRSRLLSVLCGGGRAAFSIADSGSGICRYDFEIDDTDGLRKAYITLTGREPEEDAQAPGK